VLLTGWCRLPELLSERVRGLLGHVKADDELLVVGRSDSQAIPAQRPRLDPRALDAREESRRSALPGLTLELGHPATNAVSPAMPDVRRRGRASGSIRRERRGAT
jgi:hypothetical protein